MTPCGVLALDSAGNTTAAGLFLAGVCAARRSAPRQASDLPVMVQQLLGRRRPALIAVTVGPGSFTGLRAGLALAHGLAAGWTCPLVGVGVAEACAADLALAEPNHARPIWVALHSRAGRVFLARNGVLESFALDDVPTPSGPVIITGNAAIAVGAALRQRRIKMRNDQTEGDRTRVWTIESPSLDAIARIGLLRWQGALPPLPALPLYVDGPQTTRPAAS